MNFPPSDGELCVGIISLVIVLAWLLSLLYGAVACMYPDEDEED